MQGEGFEPSRLAAIGPQPIVSASSTIPASLATISENSLHPACLALPSKAGGVVATKPQAPCSPLPVRELTSQATDSLCPRRSESSLLHERGNPGFPSYRSLGIQIREFSREAGCLRSLPGLPFLYARGLKRTNSLPRCTPVKLDVFRPVIREVSTIPYV